MNPELNSLCVGAGDCGGRDSASFFGDGGRVTGAGRGGAFLTSTLEDVPGLVGLLVSTAKKSPTSPGESAVFSNASSKACVRLSLEVEMESSNEVNEGLGSAIPIPDETEGRG